MGAPIIRYESGQTAFPFSLMTTSDAAVFSTSYAPLSGVSGFEPVVAPYGLLTGGTITPHATNDTVSVAALTASMAGVSGASATGVISVSAGTLTIGRGVTTDTHRITSITVDSSGALAAITGVDSTAFSEVRGANGGPPFIPVGSIEIGQVRVTSTSAAVVASSEIFQVVGLHQERSDFPVYAIDAARGRVTFAEALPLIHTGGVSKLVYIKGATPLFASIPSTRDWVPAEATYSISSTETYDGPVGSSSSSLGQASFTAVLKDGITDTFLAAKGKTVWIEFRPDRDKLLPKQLTQGILGVSRTNPASGNREAACTVTPSTESVDVKE